MNHQNQFFKLLMGCPYNQPTKSCSIEKYRKMSLLELVDTLNHTTCDQINVLVIEHAECSRCRTGQKIAS
jgi:hypothetical protein